MLWKELMRYLFLFLFMIFYQNGFGFQPKINPFSWNNLSNQYTVRHFTVDDGLPINSINYVYHNRDGFVYIATNDGLVKFDGDRFEIVNTSTHNLLQTNRIMWVGPGRGNEIWIVDAEYNLYQYAYGALKWFQQNDPYRHLEVKKVELFDENSVIITTDEGFFLQDGDFNFTRFSFHQTLNGIRNSFTTSPRTTYFLRDEGFYLMDEGKIEFLVAEEYLEIPVEEVFNLVRTNDGTVWLLSINGKVLEIDPQLHQKIHSIKNGENEAIWDLIELDAQHLLLSSSAGYLEFNRATGKFSSYFDELSPTIYFEDNAWNGTSNHVLTKVGETVQFDGKPILKTAKEIPYLTLDRDENIWVATNGDGLYQLIPKKILTIGNEVFPGLENVYGMAEEDGAIWVSSFSQEMFKITESDISNWTVENSSIDYSYFRSVLSANGKKYAGSFNLYEYQSSDWIRDNSWEIGGQLLDVLFKDQLSRFWIGTDQGLYLDRNGIKDAFLDANNIGLEGANGIQNYSGNKIIIASESQGVVILDENNAFRFITKLEGLSSNVIRDIYIASPDTLWIVTEDYGLNRMIIDEESLQIEEIKQVTTADGLIDNSLHRLLKDEFGYFWINSNKGIIRVSEKNLNEYLDGKNDELYIMGFGVQDGLTNIEGNGGTQNAGILTSDGKLLFPNQAGVVYTRPEWFIIDQTKSLQKPVFEWIGYQDTQEVVSSLTTLTLPKKTRAFQMKVTLPEISHPEKMELFYEIPGVTDGWEPLGTDRIAVFTNIPDGENTLSVKGRLKGEEEFRQASFSIMVPPYFYETNLFLGLMFVGIIGMFFGGYKVLLIQAKAREERLNSLVEERTKQLIEEKEKTDKALKRIQKLDESKSRFFTNFTHELRTPLSLILSPLDDMLDSDGTPVQENVESLKIMRRNAIRLKELVNQLLDVSKLNAGELSMTFEPVNLNELTRQCSTQFEHSISKKSIKFKLTGSTETPDQFIDVNAWNHICTNLLGNSLKFTPKEGSVTINIEEKKKETILEFSDSGIGIAPEDLPYIFDSYYQGDSTQAKAEGTGIGLALVKGLVERMGGEISVKSKPGEGSVFRIKLLKGTQHIRSGDKILKETNHKAEAETQISTSKEPLSKQVLLHGPKVLLVEDNEDFRMYLTSLIGKHYQIKVAENGVQGLEVLKQYQPDIIVSDIMMPEMDGYEMMRAIREIEQFKNLPFIFLSAKDSAADIEKGLNIGADIYLSKPVENKLLLTQIKVLLRREARIKADSAGKQKSHSVMVSQVTEIIQRHLGNPDLNVDMIADAMAMSSPTLYRKWKKEGLETINQTISKMRFEEALKLIEQEGLSISEAAYAVGFSHLSYFSNSFKKMYGVAPQEYISENLQA